MDTQNTETHKPNYAGIDKDAFGGMTPTGNIIPDSETCTGWTVPGISALYDKISAGWEPYGHLASNPRPDLRERHRRIYESAVENARALGCNPELQEEDT